MSVNTPRGNLSPMHGGRHVDNIIEIRCPTANGSVMVQKYLATDTKTLRIDHLTTHSKFKQITSYRDAQLQVATKEVSHKDIQKAMPPNVVHAADACILSFAVDGFDGNFSLIHDSIGSSPCAALDDLLARVNEGIIRQLLTATLRRSWKPMVLILLITQSPYSTPSIES